MRENCDWSISYKLRLIISIVDRGLKSKNLRSKDIKKVIK